MSFDIDGVTWAPQAGATHAANILARINAYRKARNEAPLSADYANAIWLICLGAGDIQGDKDLALDAAQNSYTIYGATDQQVLNLLETAGTALTQASFTSLDIQVTASASGAANVPAGTVLTIDGLANVTFVTRAAATIPASTTQTIACVAQTAGPITVVPGQVSGFATSITNVATVANATASIPGIAQETIAEARARLTQGNVVDWGVNGTIRALLAIDGITQAVVYFNSSTTVNLTLPGGTVVPPRHAKIFIIGQDATGTAIAQAYFDRMTAPTDGTQSQKYTTLVGQQIPVYFDYGGQQNLWVKVYYDLAKPASVGFDAEGNQLILQYAAKLGETVTADAILKTLTNYTYATIVSAEVSLDGVTYAKLATINANSVAVLAASRIVWSGV